MSLTNPERSSLRFAISVANLFLIFSFASTAPISARLALALSVVTIACFGALAGRSTLQELKAINQDYTDAKLGTHYARYVAEVPTDLFAALSARDSSCHGASKSYRIDNYIRVPSFISSGAHSV